MSKCENTIARSTVLTDVRCKNPTGFHQEIVLLIMEKPHVLQACLRKICIWARRGMTMLISTAAGIGKYLASSDSGDPVSEHSCCRSIPA